MDQKFILLLGDENHKNYGEAHQLFKSIGLGYKINNPVVILSHTGIPNHVYHYYRYNNLPSVKIIGTKDMEEYINSNKFENILIFGEYSKNITLLKKARTKGIDIISYKLD